MSKRRTNAEKAKERAQRIADLYAKNTGLAYQWANKMAGYLRGSPDFEDMAQVALMGLHKAARIFDPSRGLKFSTLACTCIQHELGHALKIHKRRGLAKGQSDKSILSISNEPVGESDEYDLIDPKESNFDINLEQQELKDLVAQLRNPRERKVLFYRFIAKKTLTLRCTGEKLGISKERVRQIQKKALASLRAMLAVRHGIEEDEDE